MFNTKLEQFRRQVEMMRAVSPDYASIAVRMDSLWASVEGRLRDELVGRFRRGVSVQRIDGVIVAGLVDVDLEVYIRVFNSRLEAEIVSAPRRRCLTASHSVKSPLDNVGTAVRQVVQLVDLEKLCLALGEPDPVDAELN